MSHARSAQSLSALNFVQRCDAGINRGLGVPAGFYHFAFEAGSAAALEDKRDELRAKGVEVTDVVDHGLSRSIYFRDPNGLQLEYCCAMRNRSRGGAWASRLRCP
jgi:catechol-2,3-dioxygenase